MASETPHGSGTAALEYPTATSGRSLLEFVDGRLRLKEAIQAAPSSGLSQSIAFARRERGLRKARPFEAIQQYRPKVTVRSAAPVPARFGLKPWLGLASGNAGIRHVTVLAGQGEAWPRRRMPGYGAKSWTGPRHDPTGVGCR
jgi:hypothetical protein